MKRLKRMVLIGTMVAVIGIMAFPAFAYADDGGGTTDSWNFFERFRNKVADVLGITAGEYQDTLDQAREEVLADGVSEGWLTDSQMENMQDKFSQRQERAFPGGMMGKSGLNNISALADILDMEKSDLLSELRDEKTIIEVAQEKGIDTNTLIDAYIDDLAQNLEEAVSDGDITQKYADSILIDAEENAEEMLNNTFAGGPRGRGFLR